MHKMTGDHFYFAHRLPRRTRLKVPQRRGDTGFFLSLRRRLAACTGVVSVTAAPEAASIVVYHEPGFEWSSVRFDAMGLQQANSGAQCACSCHHRAQAAGEVELGSVCEWTLRLVLSGQPVAHLVEWVASSLIRSAVNDLIAIEAAKA